MAKAELEAWQAAKGESYKERMEAYEELLHEQTKQHAEESNRFITVGCLLPDNKLDPRQMKICPSGRDTFQRNYWFALQGEYLSQDTVVFCFNRGSNPKEDPYCGGVVQQNKIMECAWRLVIISSGSPEVKTSDVEMYDDECGARPWSEKQAFFAQASQLFSRIYQRLLPMAR